MAAGGQPVSALASMAAGASIEVTPKVARAEDLRAVLRPRTDVYVTHLPRASIAERASACAAIAEAGLNAVPHVAARAATSAAALDREVGTLMDAGAVGLLLVGGGAAQRGPYVDALSALESGVFRRHGVRRLPLAGYPEGHPQIDDGALLEALVQKLDAAMACGCDVTVVTQFVFDAAPLLAWVDTIRQAGITANVRIGLSGPASPATLIAYGLRCGVGPSLKALQNRPSLLGQLRRRWEPDALASAVAAAALARPHLGIEGLHLYPFGGLAAAGDWLDQQTRRQGVAGDIAMATDAGLSGTTN
ncbi:MAG: methylenetetrahydrofolate reductase [Pseudomonadota bacterium]